MPVRKVYGLEMIGHMRFLTEATSTEGAQEALRGVAGSYVHVSKTKSKI